MTADDFDEPLNTGLRLYATGEFLRAYDAWKRIAPGDKAFPRAQEYISYLGTHALISSDLVPKGPSDSEVSFKLASQPEKLKQENPWDLVGTKDIAVDLDSKPFAKTTLDEILESDELDTQSHQPGANRPSARQNQNSGPAGKTQDSRKFALTERVAEMRRYFELGNFEAAIQTSRLVLEEEPGQLDALGVLEEAAKRQVEMYQSRLGGLDKRPRLLSSPDEIIWLNLHPRAGYLLSFVDGTMAFNDIVTVSAMPKVEVLGVMVKLLQNNAIEVV